MAATNQVTFDNITVRLLQADGSTSEPKTDLVINIRHEQHLYTFIISNSKNEKLHKTVLNKNTIGFQFGDKGFELKIGQQPLVILFSSCADLRRFCSYYSSITCQATTECSVFTQRTDIVSAEKYFQCYGALSQQKRMLQDSIRTSTYQCAMLENEKDFKGKVVLDVGCGSGILSYFAAQAGAKKVYAVEASNMAQYAQKLTTSNKLDDKIQIVPGKIEEIELPEKVDIIISEPMGHTLFNERMLETYLHAKKWLKPGGNMFPTTADLYIAPFTYDALYREYVEEANFWSQTCFYGVDLNGVKQDAHEEYFKKPTKDVFDPEILMAEPCMHATDFLTTAEEDLHRIEIPLEYTITKSGVMHGLAFWFNVTFKGTTKHIILHTGPGEPDTHWHQVLCMLQNPLFVRTGQKVIGNITMHANQRQSYDLDIEVTLDGTDIKSSNIIDLKNNIFRYSSVPGLMLN